MKVSPSTAVALVLACTTTLSAWGGQLRLERTKGNMYFEITMVKAPYSGIKIAQAAVMCMSCHDNDTEVCAPESHRQVRILRSTGNAVASVHETTKGIVLQLDPKDAKGASMTVGLMCQRVYTYAWPWNTIRVDSMGREWERLEIQGGIRTEIYPQRKLQYAREKIENVVEHSWLGLEYADTVTLGRGESKNVIYNVQGNGKAHLMIDTSGVQGLVCATGTGEGRRLEAGTTVKCTNTLTAATSVTGELVIGIGMI